jgi:hypothetical protein
MAHVSLDSIKARFLALGYLEKDVNQLRLHREVKTSKPMSDRGESLPFHIQRTLSTDTQWM